jgi:hypothetical protein
MIGVRSARVFTFFGVAALLGPAGLAAQGCSSLVPATVGGPPPPASIIQLRWLGTANYELAHGRTVVLLDAYYNRGPRNRPIGLLPDAITRADIIFIGHAHFDHISDAAAVALKTGALVVGARLSIQVVRDLGVPSSQTRVVSGRGGELLRFDGFTVEPIRAHHSVLAPAVLAKFRAAITEVIGSPTADTRAPSRFPAYNSVTGSRSITSRILPSRLSRRAA